MRELAARHHIAVLDMNRLQRKHFTRHGMHLHTRGKWQLARLIVEALDGLGVLTAAAKKAEVAPDTCTAVPPLLAPLLPSLLPPPPPSPSPSPRTDSLQLTPEPPMPTI
ncbi:hypothetical protein J6590_049314 [Homalodisca vitripennis]|nr:hypothetical protein J6590_049314 [Homalodisca vitripennis]